MVLVGTHPSALPEETLNNSKAVDAVAIKEFDYSVRDIARAIVSGENPFDIPGIALV